MQDTGLWVQSTPKTPNRFSGSSCQGKIPLDSQQGGSASLAPTTGALPLDPSKWDAVPLEIPARGFQPLDSVSRRSSFWLARPGEK
jgi:hypothetical protein